jgi:epoxyqueuosine reductase
MADPRPLIRDRALALGFDAVGFCRAELGPEARERLAAFLAGGAAWRYGMARFAGGTA